MTPSLSLFNHLLNQHPDLCRQLAPHAGRRVALVLGPVSVSGVITDTGWLAESACEPEATVRVRALAALQAQWLRKSPGFDDLVFEGDSRLAEVLAQVLGQLRWEPADDLSRLFGDVVAHRIETGIQSATDLQAQIFGRSLENWLEYWREESPLLARKSDVEQYMKAVDRLRDDSERLEKRLARLEATRLAAGLNRECRAEAGGQ